MIRPSGGNLWGCLGCCTSLLYVALAFKPKGNRVPECVACCGPARAAPEVCAGA